jgi:hypothetical protein
MYWRIRKFKPEEFVRQYGVHGALAASVMFNLFMLPKMVPSKAVTAEQKVNFERFARIVTSHLLDCTYLTFPSSMVTLEKQELGPSLAKTLKKSKLLPGTTEEAIAQTRELTEIKMVSNVLVESVKSAEQPDTTGLLPVTVRGRVVRHSAEGVDEKPFGFKYWIAIRKDNKEPILVNMQEVAQ